MIPDTTPFTPRVVENPSCARCGDALQGNRYCCPACVQAAERAVAKRQPGQSVRPSDVAAMRED